MATPEESGSLGSASIKVEVDNTRVEPTLKDTEKKVEASANGMVGSLRTATRAVTQFIGAFTAAAGIAAIAYRVGRAITENIINVLQSGTEKAQKFKDTLDMRDVDGSVKALTGRIDELNGRIEASTASWTGWALNAVRGMTIARLQEERDELRSARLSAERAQRGKKEINERLAEEKRAIEERERAEREAFERRVAREKAAAKTLKSELDQLEVEREDDDVERLRVQEAQQRRDLLEEMHKAETILEARAVSVRLVALQQLYALRIAKAEEAARREADAQIREQRRVERQTRETIGRIREDARTMLPISDLTFAIGQMNEALQAMRQTSTDISGGSA